MSLVWAQVSAILNYCSPVVWKILLGTDLYWWSSKHISFLWCKNNALRNTAVTTMIGIILPKKFMSKSKLFPFWLNYLCWLIYLGYQKYLLTFVVYDCYSVKNIKKLYLSTSTQDCYLRPMRLKYASVCFHTNPVQLGGSGKMAELNFTRTLYCR